MAGRNRRDWQRERGGALVLVLSFAALISLLAMSLLFSTETDRAVSKNFADREVALSHTDTAINEVMWRLDLRPGAFAPPAGSVIAVNNMLAYDARLNFDPLNVLSNGIDDDGDTVTDEPDELNFERDWQVRILLTPTRLSPGSPWEVTDNDITNGPPWGSRYVEATIQPQAGWREYSTIDPASPEVLLVKFKLDTDTALGDVDGDGPEIVFYDKGIALDNTDSKNSLVGFGGDGDPSNDSPYNITYVDPLTGIKYPAKGVPVIQIEAVGKVRQNDRVVAQRQILAEVFQGKRGVMKKAICARKFLDINEDIDSYRSSEGPYGCCGPGQIYENAFVGSNSWIGISTATIHGSAESGGNIDATSSGVVITGDATMGGHFNGTPTVGGTVQQYVVPKPVPCEFPIDMAAELAAAQADNDNASIPPDGVHPYIAGTNLPYLKSSFWVRGSLDVRIGAGQSLILPGGTYYFGDFDMRSSSATLQIGKDTDGDGWVDTPPDTPVKIYTSGSVVASGGIANAGKPTDLLWFCNGGTFTFSGGSALRAIVYAPNATVKFTGTSEVYGSAYGDTVSVNQPFHYDEDVLNSVTIPDGVKLLAWREE